MRINTLCPARNMHRSFRSSISLAALTLAFAAHAQQPETGPAYVPTMHFDVASIRQSPPADSYYIQNSFAPHSSSYAATNLDMMNLVLVAYGLHSYQVIGLPPSHAMFNVQAKTDSAADERFATLTPDQQRSEQRHMVQLLLADRLKLKTHWETRDGLAYQLVAMKTRGGLTDSAGVQLTPEEKLSFGERPVPPIYQEGSSSTGFSFVAHACTMNDLTGILAAQFGRPVFDKTGYTGRYNFTLRYKDIRESDRKADDMEPVPTLDRALQEQLGLKLEATKAPGEVLVVDHIEMPSDN